MSKKLAKKELTPKQKQFCVEYLKDYNATDAYLRAGYKCSKASARRNSSRLLLTNADIQKYLAEVQTEVGSASQITLERTLNEIGAIAFSEITDVLSFSNGKVTLKSSDTLDKRAIAAISSVTCTETVGKNSTTTHTEVKMHSKSAALKMLTQFYALGHDWNQAQAIMNRYGFAVVESSEFESGWEVKRLQPPQ